MAETYKKKGEDLELTTTRTITELQLLEHKERAKEDKVRAEADVVKAQARIDELDAKLTVLNA
jgi:hypothetical protein